MTKSTVLGLGMLVSLALLVFAIHPAAAQSVNPDDPYRIRITVKDPPNDLPVLAGLHLDVAGVNIKAQTVDYIGGWETWMALRDAGFDPEVIATAREMAAPEALSDYLDPGEIASRLDNYQAAFPTLAQKVQIATTVNSRPVWAMKISDNATVEEDEPAIFFDAQHHAREVMTPEIAIDTIDYLLNRYTTDPQVRQWVDNLEIWVIATINPDGASTVFTSDTSWRKNRRPNGDGSFGVDINRNYPFDWGACGGSSGTPSADDYRGPSASSEPETTGYIALARAQRPLLAVSYHSYGELVLHPYGCSGILTPESRLHRDLSSDLAAHLRNDTNTGWYSHGTSWELLYPVDGGMKDWFYAGVGAASWTIELTSTDFQPDYATWRNLVVERTRPGWQYLLDRMSGPAIWGHVKDACSGAPISATVSLDEVSFTRGETPRTSDATHGRYDWLTTSGDWHLRATKAGYVTQVWPVTVGSGRARREVRLAPTGTYAVDAYATAIVDTLGGADGDGQVDPGEAVTMNVAAYAIGGALSGLTATLSTNDSYVTITDASSSWPSIGAGGTAAPLDGFAFEVSQAAPDGHVIPFTLAFGATQSLCAPSLALNVTVNRGVPACPAYNEPMNSNPGWTIQNSTTLGWAFGTPTGGGGANGPTAAHTGSFVYGTNLSGSYAANADYKLTTTAFDLSLLRNTELRFWRYLNSETGADLASVEVSTDGINFTKIWSGFGKDTAWGLYEFDISALADGEPAVYVRFRQQSDGSTNQSGFYIDDVSICGETIAPAPNVVVTSWSLDDGVTPSCTDGDAYADAGETADLTVQLKNDGNAAATDLVAVLSTTDPNLTIVTGPRSLGTVLPGATTSATYRLQVDQPSCGSVASFDVDLQGNSGDYAGRDSTVQVRMQTDDGTPVPDTVDTFETTTPWVLTGEWQISRPRGKGGAGNVDGNGGPDPFVAYGGVRVLGVDLIGSGTSLGNYENNLSIPITATSPPYDCTNAAGVQVRFKRWLGVEASQFDHANLEAWDGSNWRIVWTNPPSDLSETSWQSVAYDVSQWADGNPAFKVRFSMSSNNAKVFCGWNIDDLTITNGYTPRLCESGTCTAGCASTSEVTGVLHAKGVSTSVLTWAPSADLCHQGTGTAYHVYRAPSPAPQILPPAQWPGDSWFADVTALDGDGEATSPSFTEAQTPAAGAVFFYLVADVGTNGAEGPKGWQGF